jgi:GDP-L-fucose synthase
MSSLHYKVIKVIDGRGFNIVENKENPLEVLTSNFHSLQSLIDEIKSDSNKICFIGSSCMYPMRDSAVTEDMLGCGAVYEGNALYSYIKLLGWQICKMAVKQLEKQAFLVIPADVFGDPEDSHFITQIMKKLHRAKIDNSPSITLWGTGTAVRHPLFKKDYQTILQKICESYTGTAPINIAPPVSWAKSIYSIALDIKEVVGYDGMVQFDASFPDGQPIKILDNSRLTSLGFSNFTPWKTALEIAYDEIKNHV